jgi:hypothetical protein
LLIGLLRDVHKQGKGERRLSPPQSEELNGMMCNMIDSAYYCSDDVIRLRGVTLNR